MSVNIVVANKGHSIFKKLTAYFCFFFFCGSDVRFRYNFVNRYARYCRTPPTLIMGTGGKYTFVYCLNSKDLVDNRTYENLDFFFKKIDFFFSIDSIFLLTLGGGGSNRIHTHTLLYTNREGKSWNSLETNNIINNKIKIKWKYENIRENTNELKIIINTHTLLSHE